MVTPVLVTTALLGWFVYQAANDALSEVSIRAVGIAANAREQALLSRLVRQRERATDFLRAASAQCQGVGEGQGPCLKRNLAEFATTERASAAALVVGGGEPILQGGEASTLVGAQPLAPGQLARFASHSGTPRPYEIIVHEEDLRLVMRFGGEAINQIFQDRYGLGHSGETFLADARGVFITEPKYRGHSGESHSHPIDARPMRECLSGKSAEVLAPDYRNVPVIHGFRFIEEIGGGCIMAHIEQAEAFTAARLLRMEVAGASLGLSVIMVGLSFVFARRVSRPMSRLTDRARALQAGDFQSAVPREGVQELQMFASTFETMASSLQLAAKERQRLFEKVEAERAHLRLLAGLSRALAESRLDQSSILDVTCRQLSEHLGDLCLLRVISEDGQRLETLAAYSPDLGMQELVRAMLEQRPQKVTEGMSGRVLAQGEPVLIPEVGAELLEQLRAESLPEHAPFLRSFTPTSLSLVPLRSHGQVVGLLSLARFKTGQPYSHDDFTLFQEVADRTSLALENARLYQQAKEAVRVREDVVAIVSHDLRNPLNAISMSVSMLLKRDHLEEWQARGLGRIASATDRASGLIRDLLDFTQARVRGIPIQPQDCDFHEVACNVVEEIRSAHPERHIEFDAAGDGKGAWDCDRIAQVVANLVGNAIQHSPAGTPVKVSARGDGGVTLSIQNQGAPIAPEVLPTLFEPFQRGGAAGRGAGGSVGLGLFIALQIVQAHGGTIEVLSNEAQGTIFTVVLPHRSAR